MTDDAALPEFTQQLLADACTRENYINHGAFSTAYTLEHIKGLEQCVLTVSSAKLEDHKYKYYTGDWDIDRATVLALKSTTNLCQPSQQVYGANLGQRLLIANSEQHNLAKPTISIKIRQPGTPVGKLWREFSDKDDKDPSRIWRCQLKAMEAVIAAGAGGRKNPFLKLVELEAEIDHYAWVRQFDRHNVHFDLETGTFGVVDQQSHSGSIKNGSRLEDLFKLDDASYMINHPVLEALPALRKALRAAEGKIDTMIKDARKEYEQDRAEWFAHGVYKLRSKDKFPACVSPFDVSSPPSIQCVRLDKPPHELIRRVNLICNKLELPAR